MQGSVRAMLGITSGAVSQRRISEASRRVAPHAFQARMLIHYNEQTLFLTSPPILAIKGHLRRRLE